MPPLRRVSWPILLSAAILLSTALGCQRTPVAETDGVHRLFADQRFRQEGSSRKRRLAFSAKIPSSRSELVAVPQNATLQWGHAARARKTVSGVVVSVSLRDGEDIDLLHEEVIRPSSRKPRDWGAGRVDLAPWAGREVEIVFEARYQNASDRPRKKARPGRVYWSSPLMATRQESPSSRPSVILILVDTLRADRLGALGAQRELTPHLDALAARGSLFESAFSQSNWTLPGAASLYTGLYPMSHGVTRQGHRLSTSPQSIARLFASNGYLTAGFHDGGYLSPNFGFGNGFDQYTQWRLENLQEIAAWLEQYRDLPFFLFLHTYAVHAPYNTVPQEYWGLYADAERLSEIDLNRQGRVGGLVRGRTRQASTPEEIRFLADLYDGEVRFVDDQIRELERVMERLGLSDRTLIAVTSDHGEEFGEHGGLVHGTSNVHTEVTRIPLILAGPGIPIGERISVPVQLTDLLPTLADLVGLEGLDRHGIDGRSLLPLLQQRRDTAASGDTERLAWSERRDSRSVRTERWTLILSESLQPRLYDRRSDPLEMRDVAADHPEVVDRLQGAIRRIIASRREQQRAEEVEIDAKTRNELRALGYLD